MWGLGLPPHAQHFWAWCVDDMVGGPFNGSKVGSDTILECGFEPNSTPKASSWDEDYPPLIYSIFILSLANVVLGFFPI